MPEPAASPGEEVCFWAPQAWIDGRWQSDVVLRADRSGHWADIQPGVPCPTGATALPGPVLAGLVNAHSHAFQRAFAGMAERRSTDEAKGDDDFWSWRDRMYGVALRISPSQLRAVAAQLDVELLCGGYTQVCEFHYLQHDENGHRYEDPAKLAFALADAADDAGIGLTLLPALYERAGFTQATLRHDQRRFESSARTIDDLRRVVNAAHRPLVNAGVAIHSLRAASTSSIADLLRRVGNGDVPIHIHVAEQTREVDECLAATGLRPIEWLCANARPDRRWQLVHATHTTSAEIEAVAAAGAGIVVCPSTEANLGDGFADLPGWLNAAIPLALGSDSQVSRCWTAELRWLEYGQRLLRGRRNVAATARNPSTAARLVDALSGQASAAGFERWGLRKGARADALVIDVNAAGLSGVPAAQRLDALLFATDAPSFREVYVAGRRVVENGRHIREFEIAEHFRDAMSALWDAPKTA